MPVRIAFKPARRTVPHASWLGQALLAATAVMMPSLSRADMTSIYAVFSGANVSGTTVLATGSQQAITVRLMVSGTQSPIYPTQGFETVITVTGTNGGSAAQVVAVPSSIVANGVGFLFPNGVGIMTPSYLGNQADTYTAVAPPSPINLGAMSSATPLLELTYNLSAAITQGSTFTFSLLSDPVESYGFSSASGTAAYAGFNAVSSTLAVVPEPDLTAGIGLASSGLIAAFGWRVGRSRLCRQ